MAGMIQGKCEFVGKRVTIMSPLAKKVKRNNQKNISLKLFIFSNVPNPSLILPLESSIVRKLLLLILLVVTLLDGNSITAGCDVLLRFKLVELLTGRLGIAAELVEVAILLLLLVLIGIIVFGDALTFRLSIVT